MAQNRGRLGSRAPDVCADTGARGTFCKSIKRPKKAAKELTLPDPDVCLRVNGVPVASRPGQVVLEALQSAGCLVQSACSGRGACGLCQVKVCGGEASAPTAIEKRFFQSPQTHSGPRLACQMRLTASVCVIVPNLDSPLAKNAK